jgi:hypothetical protein
MFTHTFNRSWSRAGESIVKSVDVLGGAENNIDESIPAATADQLVAFSLDVSQCKGLFLVCDKDLVVKTNSNSAPANVFTLAANVPYLWIHGDAAIRDTDGTAVTVDITSLHVDNEDADAAAALQIRCLVDPTV